MDNKLEVFKDLSDLFLSHSYSLYLVGGTVRDFLLDIPLKDMDLVTNATPSEMKEFIPEGDYTFERFGSVKLKYKGIKFDITTLRKEDGYSDFRHPNKIKFTNSLKEDVLRRDITINALYMDKDLNVIDYVNGKEDINNKIIKMIGNPETRISEDPLRIIRILRFQLETNFKIEKELEKAIKNNFSKVHLLKKEKVEQEIKKSNHKEELVKILKSYGLIVDLK